jgi:hypothetical protein
MKNEARPVPSDPERRWPGVVVGYMLLSIVLGAVTSLAYDTAAPAYQPQVIRVAVALAIGVALIHILNRWRGSRERQSRFDAALTRQRIAPKTDIAFLRARDTVAYSVRSQSGFAHLFAILADARVDAAEVHLPAYRRWLRLGPSRQAVAALIAKAENARAERR